jgi:hypothetical protein
VACDSRTGTPSAEAAMPLLLVLGLMDNSVEGCGAWSRLEWRWRA